MELRSWRMDTAQHASHCVSPSVAAALSRLHYNRGEQRLMLAVLVDAISSIERYGMGQGANNWGDCQAAVRWVTAHEQRWPFSFENICVVLDLDSAKLRATLRAEFPALFLTRTHGGTSRPKASGGLQPVQG
jgi:hypothetical protein